MRKAIFLTIYLVVAKYKKTQKEAVMEFKGNKIRCKRLEEWLGGVSIGEKIKPLEKGKLLTCSKCGYTVFDKEEPENYIRRRCLLGGYEHSFIESENYIILKRGFKGIMGVVNYRFGTAEDAVVRYFQSKR